MSGPLIEHAKKVTLSRLSFVVTLGVFIAGLYYNTLDNIPTNWDDPSIFNNHSLRAFSFENIRQIFTLHDLSTFQPIRNFSYLLDFTIWGSNVVLGLHVQNIVLYFLMNVAAWLFLMRLFLAFNNDTEQAFIWSACTIFIFAALPVHVESVAWLYARKQSLMGVFFFLSLRSFLLARGGAGFHYLACFVFMVLAVLSQPTALVLPFLMLVIDLALVKKYPERNPLKKRLLMPMLVLVLMMMVRLVNVMRGASDVPTLYGGSFLNNIFAASQIIISYLPLIGFNVYFAADYPIKLYPGPQYWQAWAYLAANLALVASAAVAFSRGRYLSFVLVSWYYVLLLPVSHLVPISQIMTDRYAFLPSLSWCVGLGYVLTLLWRGKIEIGGMTARIQRVIAAVGFVSLVGIYTLQTIVQNDIWQDSQTLWEHTLEKYPDSYFANVNLSTVYFQQGRLKDAQRLCLQAVDVSPEDFTAQVNLARVHLVLGNYEESNISYMAAFQLRPERYEVLFPPADFYRRRGDYANLYRILSIIHESGLKVQPERKAALVCYLLGYAAWKQGKELEAKSFLEQARELSDNDMSLLESIATVYTSMGLQ